MMRREVEAIAKYERRGWPLLNCRSTDELQSARRVGDAMSWVIAFDTEGIDGQHQDLEVFRFAVGKDSVVLLERCSPVPAVGLVTATTSVNSVVELHRGLLGGEAPLTLGDGALQTEPSFRQDNTNTTYSSLREDSDSDDWRMSSDSEEDEGSDNDYGDYTDDHITNGGDDDTTILPEG
jgi:hypothetical protein